MQQALLFLIVLGLAGCESQMLLNLVKLRYGDTPVFLDVMFIFTLVETGGKEGAPVLTIPTQ